jgi:hypothetical protein
MRRFTAFCPLWSVALREMNPADASAFHQTMVSKMLWEGANRMLPGAGATSYRWAIPKHHGRSLPNARLFLHATARMTGRGREAVDPARSFGSISE